MTWVSLSTSKPTVVTLTKRFGVAYGLVQIVDDEGVTREAPVALGAYLPIAGYRNDIEVYLKDALHEGMQIQIVASGSYAGENQTLPVVEIITPDGGTLTETLLRKGWAIPDERLLNDHLRTDKLVQAVADARVSEHGLWRDDAYTSHVEQLLSTELHYRTGGNIIQRDGLVMASMLMAAIVGICLGLRAWYVRYAKAPLEQERQRPSFLLRAGGAFAAFLGLRSVVNRNDFHKMPSTADLRELAERQSGDDVSSEIQQDVK